MGLVGGIQVSLVVHWMEWVQEHFVNVFSLSGTRILSVLECTPTPCCPVVMQKLLGLPSMSCEGPGEFSPQTFGVETSCHYVAKVIC